jgi:hypothetical protein
MPDLIADLKAALETKHARVRTCEAALAEATADRDAFAKNIADELGIVMTTPRGGRPGCASVGTRRDRIVELLGSGKSINEIADELGTRRALIDNDLSVLRRQGKIVDKGKPSEMTSPRDDDAEESDAETDGPEVPAETQDAGEKGDSKDALMAEVTRQQGGIRGKVVILGCTVTKKHSHMFRVDRIGNGTTTPDSTGHGHHVYRFEISETDKHRHGLVAKK